MHDHHAARPDRVQATTSQASVHRPRITRRAALGTWAAGTASLLLLAACGGSSSNGETASQAVATAMSRIATAGPAGTGPMGPGGPAGPGAAVQTPQPSPATSPSPASSPVSGNPAGVSLAQQSLPACVLTPQQTEGPYFVDEKLHRSDIRTDPVTGKISEGVPLTLQLQVTQVASNACTPMPNVYVDLWQCDALGVYSDVNDRNTGSAAGASKFLRGYQQTDEQGRVGFTTIYPGWYQGRAVHIHFKVRTALDGTAREQTSQFYFDDALTDRVHALPPYNSKGSGRLRNDRDGIYRTGGPALTVPVVQDGDGYAGTYTIGVQLS